MTVKPPGGPGSSPPVAPDAPAEKPAGAGGFTVGIEDAAGTRFVATDLGALVERVRSGAITVEQAVDAIVDRTLADPALARLGPERREELRESLRQAVAADPVLSQLAGQIAR